MPVTQFRRRKYNGQNKCEPAHGMTKFAPWSLSGAEGCHEHIACIGGNAPTVIMPALRQKGDEQFGGRKYYCAVGIRILRRQSQFCAACHPMTYCLSEQGLPVASLGFLWADFTRPERQDELGNTGSIPNLTALLRPLRPPYSRYAPPQEATMQSR
jgi:hypothetical protein